MSIAPLRKAPLRRTVNRLLDDIGDALPDCRRSWWMARRTTCLANQWAIIQEGAPITLAAQPEAGAKQIADALYDPAEARLRIDFHDGSTSEVYP